MLSSFSSMFELVAKRRFCLYLFVQASEHLPNNTTVPSSEHQQPESISARFQNKSLAMLTYIRYRNPNNRKYMTKGASQLYLAMPFYTRSSTNYICGRRFSLTTFEKKVVHTFWCISKWKEYAIFPQHSCSTWHVKTYLHITGSLALYIRPMISNQRRHVYGRALICAYQLGSGAVASEARRKQQTRLASRTFVLLRVSPSSSPVVGNRRKLTACRPLAAPRMELQIVNYLQSRKTKHATKFVPGLLF